MPSEEQWWSKPGAYKPQRRSGPFDARNKSVTTVTQTWSPPSWPLVCPVKIRPSKVRSSAGRAIWWQACGRLERSAPSSTRRRRLAVNRPRAADPSTWRRPTFSSMTTILTSSVAPSIAGVSRSSGSSKPSQPSCPSRSTAALGHSTNGRARYQTWNRTGQAAHREPAMAQPEPSPPLPSAPILLAHLRAAVADLVAADPRRARSGRVRASSAARWRRCMGHALPAGLGKVGPRSLAAPPPTGAAVRRARASISAAGQALPAANMFAPISPARSPRYGE